MLLCSISTTGSIKALESDLSLEGDGTVYSPFVIKSETDLIKFKEYVIASNETNNNFQASAILANDITLTQPWSPIGNDNIVYQGIFNGQGHTISNLNIDSNEKYVGLFAINNGHVLNLTVAGTITSSGDYIGGIAGANNGKISDSNFDGNINSSSEYAAVGGITGINTGAVTDVVVTGEFEATGTGSSIGGVIGVVESGSLYHAINKANINLNVLSATTDSDRESMAGGIAGFNYEGLVNVSYNQGNVTGNDEFAYTGGIVGLNNGHIKQSGNVASVTGNYYTGGVAGYLFKNRETSSKSTAIIEDSFNCQLTNNSFVGYNDEENMGEIKESFNVDTTRSVTGINNLTEQEIKSGKLTWQLNDLADEQLWYQNLSDVNSTPYLSEGIQKDQVYQIDETTFTNECETHIHSYNENGVCTVCGEKIITLKGLSLVLDGSLGLNFTYEIDDDFVNETIAMTFKIRDRVENIEFKPQEHGTVIDGKQYYIVRVDINSDEMSEKIANTAKIEKDGKIYKIKNKEYCGYDYLEKITTDNSSVSTDNKLVLSKLANELASYDYYAFSFFKLSENKYLATIPYRLQADLDKVKSEQLISYKQYASRDNDSYKLKHYSSNMSLREWVSGYYSAQLKDGNSKPDNVYIGYRFSDDEEFTYNETTVSNNRYYGYGPKVASANLDQTYQIAFFEKDDEGNYHQLSSIKYASVYSYLYTMISKNESLNLNATQKAQLNMIKSVYYYGETSKEYFNLTNTEVANENN